MSAVKFQLNMNFILTYDIMSGCIIAQYSLGPFLISLSNLLHRCLCSLALILGML